MLFFITQQFSLLVPGLQPVPVDYVMTWTQRFGGFERQFERLKRLQGMAAVLDSRCITYQVRAARADSGNWKTAAPLTDWCL
jgi:hypothetical protein